jgi:peptide/nickel transport system substrate-binding protein
MPRLTGLFSVVLTVMLVGCAPAQNQAQTQTQSPSQAAAPAAVQSTPGRTLVLAHRYEPATLAPKIIGSNGPLTTTRLFNAALSVIDDKGQAVPYLAEALPQLNTDTWRVLPDGKMETTYRLRENLTWQDGKPLTADDFVFSFRMYKDSSLGAFVATPQDAMEGVLAPDPRTVVVQWRAPNAGGGSLTFEDLDPLPRHIFEAPYTEYTEGRLNREAFLGDPMWSTGYVGSGPYRLERWEPGSQIEGVAFAGHALGKPKIERMIVRIFIDENTTLAAVLAGGQLDYTSSNTLRFQHLSVLRQDWERSGKGKSVAVPNNAVFLFLQQRPEFVGHEALLDVRVRRALAHAIDREALNDGLFDGLGAPAETPVSPSVPFYPELDRQLTKYPLDPNRSTQLMRDAGFTRNAEGFFADGQGRRFHIDFTVQASTEIERMQAILSDTWQRSGFEVRPVVMGTQLFTQQETRHTLPGLGYSNITSDDRTFLSTEIGTAANRWSGNNRSGWVNPEYDRLFLAASSTLDLNEHGRYIAQMMALVNDQLPGYTLYWAQAVHTWVNALKGPATDHQVRGFGKYIKSTPIHWNIHEWYFSQ